MRKKLAVGVGLVAVALAIVVLVCDRMEPAEPPLRVGMTEVEVNQVMKNDTPKGVLEVDEHRFPIVLQTKWPMTKGRTSWDIAARRLLISTRRVWTVASSAGGLLGLKPAHPGWTGR
jgi:hypothetical protein